MNCNTIYYILGKKINNKPNQIKDNVQKHATILSKIQYLLDITQVVQNGM